MNRIAAVVAGLSLAFVGTTNTVLAETLYVGNGEGDYATIAAAVDAASDGDTIQLWAGEGTGPFGDYREWNITVDKNITIQGCLDNENTDINIIADHNFVGLPIFTITATVLIRNLTIGANQTGPGIVFETGSSYSTLDDCYISTNYGGGIRCISSNPTIKNCSIIDNTAAISGAGIYCYNSSPTINSCRINKNSAIQHGGGIYCENSSPIHSGCTFSDNTPDNVYGDSDWNPLRGEGGPSFITLENCTLCGTGEHIAGNIPILHLGDNHISDCIDDGDLDGDGDVDTDDLNALHTDLGICKHDTNHDGVTDIDDLLDVVEGWNLTCGP